MGCVSSFHKNYDKCIIVLRQYGRIVQKNKEINNNEKEKLVLNKKANLCKKQLNEALTKMNENVKFGYESEQLIELNDMYQKLLSLESERKKIKFVDKENESDKSSEKFSIEYKIDENNIIRFKD
jgi:hypothetical protein